ncbi:unnamed protein product [Clavelina lepadiformis]|uniref:Uncharacterized protein n=1 Tax=Clavelina lepadiformis TaxID=159417 RepID=A0ABP0GFQ1_CLALP
MCVKLTLARIDFGSRGRRDRVDYEKIKQQSQNSDIIYSTSSRDGEKYFTSGIMLKKNTKRFEKKKSCTARRIFFICIPACLLALVAACVTSSIGIVWMQVQLKRDMDDVKDRLTKLEQWKADEPASLANVQELVTSLEKEMMQMREGDMGIRTLNTKIAKVQHQLDSDQGKEDATIKFAAALDDIGTLQQKLKDNNERQEIFEAASKKHDHDFNSRLEDIQQKVSEVDAKSSIISLQVNPLVEKYPTFGKDIVDLIEKMNILNKTISAMQEEHLSSETKSLSQNQNLIDQNGKNLRPVDLPVPSDMRLDSTPIPESGKDEIINSKPFEGNIAKQRVPSVGTDSANVALNVDNKSANHESDDEEEVLSTSHDTDRQVGDTTTSFTQIPKGKESHIED